MTDQKISYEEIAYSNMISIEAIVSLLTRKGLITQQEILDELKAIRVRDEREKN
jgi:DNA-binding CsgD family transcriptional regulator